MHGQKDMVSKNLANKEQVLKVLKIFVEVYFVHSRMCSWVPPSQLIVCGSVQILDI